MPQHVVRGDQIRNILEPSGLVDQLDRMPHMLKYLQHGRQIPNSTLSLKGQKGAVQNVGAALRLLLTGGFRELILVQSTRDTLTAQVLRSASPSGSASRLIPEST